MPAIRAQVILKTTTNVPADFVTNSFCFADPAAITDTAGLTGAIKSFYDSIRTAIGFPTIAQNGHEIKFYDLPGVMPNYPFATTTWNFATAPAGDTYASECAVCLSFQGAKIPGLAQARRRGRIYLGPCSNAISLNGRPVAATRTSVAGAAASFKTAVNALPAGGDWSVWSPTTATAVGITNGWVDDAWDIQRRRGLVATARTTFT